MTTFSSIRVILFLLALVCRPNCSSPSFINHRSSFQETKTVKEHFKSCCPKLLYAIPPGLALWYIYKSQNASTQEPPFTGSTDFVPSKKSTKLTTPPGKSSDKPTTYYRPKRVKRLTTLGHFLKYTYYVLWYGAFLLVIIEMPLIVWWIIQDRKRKANERAEAKLKRQQDRKYKMKEAQSGQRTTTPTTTNSPTKQSRGGTTGGKASTGTSSPKQRASPKKVAKKSKASTATRAPSRQLSR